MTTQRKLTKAQQTVLDEMLKPDVVAHYMPYMGRFNPRGYWFLSSTHQRCTKQVDALMRLKLVKIIKRDWCGSTAEAVR